MILLTSRLLLWGLSFSDKDAIDALHLLAAGDCYLRPGIPLWVQTSDKMPAEWLDAQLLMGRGLNDHPLSIQFVTHERTCFSFDAVVVAGSFR